METPRDAPAARDPDALLAALQSAAGPPPLTPLHIGVPPGSARRGVAARGVNAARTALVRLLAPTLTELVNQLERDRYRQRAELERLAARVAEMEARR